MSSLENGKIYLAGTAIRALVTQYVPTKSGILVPPSALIKPAPIDATFKYIPWSSVSGEAIPIEVLIEEVKKYDRDQLVLDCSQLQSLLPPGGRHGTNFQDALLESWPELAGATLKEVATGDVLFGRQSVAVLMKLAIAYGGEPSTSPRMPVRTLVIICMALQDYFGSTRDEEDPHDHSMEITANYWFHHRLNPRRELDRFEQRWPADNPVTKLIESQFEQKNGFPLQAFLNLGLHLALEFENVRCMFYLDRSVLEDIEFHRAVDLISADHDQMRDALTQGDLDIKSLSWTFEAFHRFPVYVCSDGKHVILSDSWVLKRCLGFPLVYDATKGENVSSRKRVFAAVENLFEGITCARILKAFGGDQADRIVREDDLKQAFPGRTADICVDYGTSWLAIEICSARGRREGLSAVSRGDYEALIAQVVDEGEQAISTCLNLFRHSKEPNVKFREVPGGSRFYPIVVMTEGFPTNPISLNEIRGSLRHLIDKSVTSIAPLEVIGPDELEQLLLITEKLGVTIPELLEDKNASNFHADSINNYLSLGRRDLTKRMDE